MQKPVCLVSARGSEAPLPELYVAPVERAPAARPTLELCGGVHFRSLRTCWTRATGAMTRPRFAYTRRIALRTFTALCGSVTSELRRFGTIIW